MDVIGFWLPSILMGLGIAIDVALATTSQFRNQSLGFKTWTLPIMATHIGFPAIGYYLFWGLGEAVPFLSIVLGILGFILVALFVYEVICESIGVEPIFGISTWIAGVFGLEEGDSRRFIAILAVSWDALWSGPAKAAQAAAGNWTTTEVFLSFLVAGVVVAIVAQVSLWVALWLRRRKFKNAVTMARTFFYAKQAELSVIGGFGVLSLWQGVLGNGNLYYSIALAFIVIFVIFSVLRRRLMRNELGEAREAVENSA